MSRRLPGRLTQTVTLDLFLGQQDLKRFCRPMWSFQGAADFSAVDGQRLQKISQLFFAPEPAERESVCRALPLIGHQKNLWDFPRRVTQAPDTKSALVLQNYSPVFPPKHAGCH